MASTGIPLPPVLHSIETFCFVSFLSPAVAILFHCAFWSLVKVA